MTRPEAGTALLVVAGDLVEAETMHAALEAAGIPSWLRFDSVNTTLYPSAPGTGAVEVFVPEAELGRAAEVVGLDGSMPQDDSWMAQEPWRSADPGGTEEGGDEGHE